MNSLGKGGTTGNMVHSLVTIYSSVPINLIQNIFVGTINR
jgi:hypothetical protein